MPSTRIITRDRIRELVATLPGFSADRVQLYKMDIAEKTPFASVYLDRMNSDVETMYHQNTHEANRTLRVAVDLHLNNVTDADAVLDSMAVELERKVLQAARVGELGDIRDIALVLLDFKPTKTNREKSGNSVLVFEAVYFDSVDLS